MLQIDTDAVSDDSSSSTEEEKQTPEMTKTAVLQQVVMWEPTEDDTQTYIRRFGE
jgi:hypothetical protein